MSDLSRLLAPFVRRLGNMLARGTIAAVNALNISPAAREQIARHRVI